MGYAELLKTGQSLPKEKQSEVFDFVAYLAARCGVATDTVHDQWSEAEFTEFSMRQAARSMEKDTVHYTLGDLREHWQ